jgi:methylenetetrahydrofolate dehydrogenase (NADP+) / methenyltetrahydrofolate cyclohydrolase
VAKVIDGKAIAARVRAEVKREVDRRRGAGEVPGLATVLVGDDEGSRVYVAGKHRACQEVGIRSIRHDLPGDTTQEELLELVDELNADRAVNGIIVQLPLPSHLNAGRVIRAIDPAKDVDGLTPTNAGLLVQGEQALVPATPSGIMELLREVGSQLEGAEAVVLGRSQLVG